MTDAPTEILPVPDPAQPTEQSLPVLAAGACRSCSSPLAADQRYCLSCGTRVAAPRVEWASALGGVSSGAAASAPERQRAGARWTLMLDRVGGPMGAAAVVLVALGVGFLLGQGSSGPSGPATIIQRPPVVNVQGGGTAAPSDASGTGNAGATTGSGSKKRSKDSGGSTAGIPKAQTQDNAGGDLNRLRAQPEDQATGGTAPRRDNKPAGGGTDAETIG
jgi:hypothetical protein